VRFLLEDRFEFDNADDRGIEFGNPDNFGGDTDDVLQR